LLVPLAYFWDQRNQSLPFHLKCESKASHKPSRTGPGGTHYHLKGQVCLALLGLRTSRWNAAYQASEFHTTYNQSHCWLCISFHVPIKICNW
jgi:hypothetical protein